MKKKVDLAEGEIVVSQILFGIAVRETVKAWLKYGGYFQQSDGSNWYDSKFRQFFSLLDGQDKQSVITAIEVAIKLDKHDPLQNKEMWEKIVKDLRPARSPFTIKYQCSKCKVENVKLWRDYQTFADHVELECAACLAPNVRVDDEGRSMTKLSLRLGDEVKTDQLNGKVPAIPFDDTYWGYMSVPSQDVEWWKNLPTYSKEK